VLVCWCVGVLVCWCVGVLVSFQPGLKPWAILLDHFMVRNPWLPHQPSDFDH